MKMNKEVIEQWVDALQNGEYVQTQKVLREVDVRNSESFCCLGVLCDLYAKSHKGANWSDDFDGGLFAIGDEEKEGEPPQAVAEWAGLDNTQLEECIRMNDNLNYTFKDISLKVWEWLRKEG